MPNKQTTMKRNIVPNDNTDRSVKHHCSSANAPVVAPQGVPARAIGFIQTLHFADDELDKPASWRVKRSLHRVQRPRLYNHIANTVPPEFITKAGYRHTHSLTHAAFKCIHDKYHQLKVVQSLARLDVEALWIKMESLNEPAVYLWNPQENAVATIWALVVMIGIRVDTTALTLALGMNMEVAPLNAIEILAVKSGRWQLHPRVVVAHHWFQTQWNMIRTLTSRSLQLPKIAPQYEDTELWIMCLKRVLLQQVGLNWRKPKNGVQFEVTSASMWSKLGINVSKYVEWYCSPHEAQFGIIPKSVQCCRECDGAGDDVQCLRQNNIWRCTSRPSQDSWPHRELFEPLDVNAAWPVASMPSADEEG
jgi:hypothetical protein